MHSLLSLACCDTFGESLTCYYLVPNEILTEEDFKVIQSANLKELVTKKGEHFLYPLDGGEELDEEPDDILRVLSALSGGSHSTYNEPEFAAKKWWRYAWSPFDQPQVNLTIASMYSMACNGYIPYRGSIYE